MEAGQEKQLQKDKESSRGRAREATDKVRSSEAVMGETSTAEAEEVEREVEESTEQQQHSNSWIGQGHNLLNDRTLVNYNPGKVTRYLQAG
ncbi:hypothetical protein PoB_006694300 [Plakobranchus ocellatus]|uniref:Uncharacterized protein n=1 Tax=Plakobranchus ocellatus TaxID=259542 RepID=A0AAV4D870_9GAST|nr:hypothetical protein PoB_006694300 [Plakobranchus ocellatus]